MFDSELVKTIGANYEVVLKRKDFIVSLYFKGKLKKDYKFNKFYKSVNFYAALKKPKDAKEASELARHYY